MIVFQRAAVLPVFLGLLWGLGACGSDAEVTSEPPSVSLSPGDGTTPPTAALIPSGDAPSPHLDISSTAPSDAEHLTEGAAPTQSNVGPTSASAANFAATCGEAPSSNPNQSYKVVTFDKSTQCSDAMPIAQQYSEHVGDNTQYVISEWACGPSETQNILSVCTKGIYSFGLVQNS